MSTKELAKIAIFGIIKGVTITGFILLLIGLSACASPTIKTQFIFPDDNLMTDCAIAQPPDISHYSKQSWDKKEDILVKDISVRIVDAGICNERWDKLREWKRKFSKQQQE